MNNHPKPWRIKKDNNEIAIIDKNGIKVLTMSNHSVLVGLNKQKLSLAKKIVRLMNDSSN